jgi:hypothetical protein
LFSLHDCGQSTIDLDKYSKLDNSLALRPCVKAIIASNNFTGSHSIERLIVDNEISGVKCLKCKTIYDLGLCLKILCPLYLSISRRGEWGSGAPSGYGALAPTVKPTNLVVVTSSDQSGLTPDYHKGTGLSKRERRKRLRGDLT